MALRQGINHLKQAELSLQEYCHKFENLSRIQEHNFKDENRMKEKEFDNKQMLFVALSLVFSDLKDTLSEKNTLLSIAICYFDNILSQSFLKKCTEEDIEQSLNTLVQYGLFISSNHQEIITINHLKQQIWRSLAVRNGGQETVIQSFADKILTLLEYKEPNLENVKEVLISTSHALSFLNSTDVASDEKIIKILLKIAFHQLCVVGDSRFALNCYERIIQLSKEKASYVQESAILKYLNDSWASESYYSNLKELLTIAVQISERYFEKNYIHLGYLLENLGLVWNRLNDWQNSNDFFIRALEIKKKHFPSNNIQIARTLENIANNWGQLGNFQRQKELLLETLQIVESSYHKDHFKIGIALVNLSSAMGNLGDYKKQKKYLELALEINEKYYGTEHIQTAVTLIGLGNAVGLLNDYENQRKLQEKALEILERKYPNNYIEIVTALDNLAIAWGELGDHERKKTLLIRSLKIKEKLYENEKNHPQLAITLTNLGNAWGSCGNYDQKKELLTRALQINETSLGKTHPNTCITLVNLANVWFHDKNYELMKELLQRALKISNECFGIEHLNTGIIHAELAKVWNFFGNYRDEKDSLTIARKIFERYYGLDDIKVGGVLINLGKTFRALGEFIEGRTVLKAALKIYEKMPEKNMKELNEIYLELSELSGILNNEKMKNHYFKRAQRHKKDKITNFGQLCLPWHCPIVQRNDDIQKTGKPRFLGLSLSSDIFKDVGFDKEWLGKSLSYNKEKSEAYAIKERIAADIYTYYPTEVQRIELCLQKMTKVNGRFKLDGDECINTMSELLDGFKSRKKTFGDSFKLTNRKTIEERGLENIRAVAALIIDIVVKGVNGGNIGFQIIYHPSNGIYAKKIKINPRAAFDIHSDSINRKKKVALIGSPKDTELNFYELQSGAKQEFAETLYRISQPTDATFRGIFNLEAKHNFLTYYELIIDKLTKFFTDLKAAIMKEYQECLFKYRNLQQKSPSKENNFKTDSEELTRICGGKVYQEELDYYIDPNVEDKDDPKKHMTFTEAMHTYLDFERQKTSIMLIKGESGVGKSLALRSLEQRLIEEKRLHETSPMPIHVDLKKFNKHNVIESFEKTLKEKYHNKYDPNKSRLVVLMDGYDEIAGGCQLNLYKIQHLDRYSKNIRVIITCRTQYLTSGYQEWFKPAEGDFKELEIQQFNEEQIKTYLMNYSRELEKAERQNYQFTEYQKKIEACPGLKELIVNPFMLRLVTESLPRLDDHIKSSQREINLNKNGEEAKMGTEPALINRYRIFIL